MADTIKVEIRQIGRSTFEAVMRQHRVLIDRPAAKGGDDQGPLGGELFLAAFGGCFMSNLLAAIRAREAEVSDVRAEVTGTLAESPGRFSAIEVRVSADCRDQELLPKLVEIAERSCLVTNTLRPAVELSIHTAESAAA
jgi:putative redox protein